jgi:hypothetical protein
VAWHRSYNKTEFCELVVSYGACWGHRVHTYFVDLSIWDYGSGYVNSQNRFPMLIPQVPVPDVEVGVWCAVSATDYWALFIFLRLNLHWYAMHILTQLFWTPGSYGFLLLWRMKSVHYFKVLGTTHLVWDSSVGIATHYGLDDPGVKYRWGWDFLHPSRRVLGPTQLPIRWVLGLSQG